MKPSTPLSAVIGGKAMPRTEVTKKLWAYIKKNGLQDAKKRTMINADDNLKVVFGGKKQVSMFEMTKLVSKHLTYITKGGPGGGRKSIKPEIKRKFAPAKRKIVKKAAKPKVKRKPNAAFMKPMMPSTPLSAVIGGKPMPRTEVTKKLWLYIKKNGLQDAKKRTMINADDNLKVVFGGKKQVSMFEMTKLVSKHLKDT